ncbi:GIY-YIG nuclease family protein [Pseudodesulfovibrio senegalensis]|jgi:putative endonuclease|uniref:GIY-YIG nuclease family protein n=1 Tax=Pseudodesulfovibrio senegalensis TaxID=1721087 RepID=A0A6N6N8Q0_9BACT|nr:GIY-YIG nuclease family protein [Pseudodesulfovibrio senegalensis]KAB1443609.1 GIY-YIG nuclease family protein [Pseudodesulfovibrio senegalensis]
MAQWFIYLLTCSDKSYYCGITTDVQRRLAQHNAGKASKYTRARLPASLTASTLVGDKSEALRAELFVKRLPREKKIAAVHNKSWS